MNEMMKGFRFTINQWKKCFSNFHLRLQKKEKALKKVWVKSLCCSFISLFHPVSHHNTRLKQVFHSIPLVLSFNFPSLPQPNNVWSEFPISNIIFTFFFCDGYTALTCYIQQAGKALPRSQRKQDEKKKMIDTS